ncbi:metalloregulator ArsR/SmtB family transcription factor [Paenibacillus sp. UMB4589-SE434]|uniref:ArsR/SmtB family transcription factor n=1 Tax=Paenibacillus sp. UMB4589-SE434 TaxID=3046314 RepID=UPI00254C9CCA|nr:metalloregulator ArsR/SmtB family transcription factor [Paenibacillus sp. UMB4589-SE434]MDK8181460.1 metalloregulator ArsR/SmtB family transcription factor [Paenibacillus sp. UMB4589-SE434]
MIPIAPSIYAHISPVFEWFAAMYRVVNHEMLTPSVPNAAAFASKDIDRFVKEARQAIGAEGLKDLQLFFNPESSMGIYLLKDFYIKGLLHDIQAAIHELEHLPAKDLLNAFLRCVKWEDTDVIDEHSEWDALSLLSHIKQSTLSEEEQWKVFYFAHDEEGTKRKFLAIVTQFYETVYAAFSMPFETIHEQTVQQLRHVFEEERAHNLNALLGLDLDEKMNMELETIFIPSYFFHTSSMLLLNDKQMLCILGANRQAYLQAKRNQSQQISDIFKLLADEKRIKIIQLLNQAPRYGYELAKEIELTNSTVSHHVNALSQAGLVKATRHENRVMYQVQPEQIERLLEELSSLLLPHSRFGH